MSIVVLGAVGLGLVWGWLIGGLEARGRRLLLEGLALGAATLLLAAQVTLLADWPALPHLLGAAGLAALLHRAWRWELRARFGANSQGEPPYE